MKNKSFYIGMFVIVCTFVMVAYVCYLLFFPTSVITFTSSALPVTPERIHAGEDITYIKQYCATTNGVAFGYPTLVNVNGTESYGSIISVFFFTPGCHTRIVHYPIPKDVKPGKYYLTILDEVRPNNIRLLYKTISTAPFEIMP